MMKVTFGLIALLMLPVMGAGQARAWEDDFIPRDPVVSQSGLREWAWEGRDSLAIEAPLIANYTPAGTPRVVVTGSEEMLAHVRFGQGRIRVDPGFRYSGNERLVATVTGVTVHNFYLAGSGRANLSDLNLDTMNLAVHGSGQVTARGRVGRVAMGIAGSGDADLDRLKVLRADIHISGSGNVDVSPRDEARLIVSGSGNVRMAARPPSFFQSVTGSGGARFAR